METAGIDAVVVKDGVVINIVTVDDVAKCQALVGPDYGLIVASNVAQIGWLYDEGTKVLSPPPEPPAPDTPPPEPGT